MNVNTYQHILDELRSEFQAKALRREELFLLSPDDAVDFIRRAVESGLIVVGVDGYSLLHTGCLQLLGGYSNDIADHRDIPYEEFVVSTMNLIQSGIADGILFDVVVDTITDAHSRQQD